MAEPSWPAPRILVVDDEPVLLTVLSRMLRDEGYTVQSVGSAEDALAVLERDLGSECVITDAMVPYEVVSDVRLGNRNGCALGREIVRRWPGTRLLFISGYVEQELFSRKICPGNLPLLPKPFRMEDFLRAVEMTLVSDPWVPDSTVESITDLPTWPDQL